MDNPDENHQCQITSKHFQGSGCGLRLRGEQPSSRRKRRSGSQSVSQSVSSRSPRAHYTTASKDGSAPLGQHKYSQRILELPGFPSSIRRRREKRNEQPGGAVYRVEASP